jgi:hypothetical protein
MKRLLVAFLVTWDVSGYSLFNCQDPKQVDQVVGLCVTPLQATRSAVIANKTDAMKMVASLKTSKNPAYVVSNVKVYEESK